MDLQARELDHEEHFITKRSALLLSMRGGTELSGPPRSTFWCLCSHDLTVKWSKGSNPKKPNTFNFSLKCGIRLQMHSASFIYSLELKLFKCRAVAYFSPLWRVRSPVLESGQDTEWSGNWQHIQKGALGPPQSEPSFKSRLLLQRLNLKPFDDVEGGRSAGNEDEKNTFHPK